MEEKKNIYKVVVFPIDDIYDKRYCIVDVRTGEILDDAQGYGYRTIQKAHAAWTYKSKSEKEHRQAEQKHKDIWKWLKENKEVLNILNNESYYAMEDGMPFGVKELREALKGWNGELKFQPREIMSAWRKGEYLKSRKKKKR